MPLLKWICFGIVLSMGGETLSAAQMRPMPLAELAQRADLVVLGKVQSKSCQRDASGRIFTKVELTVSEVWKGTTTNTTLTIVHGGGRVGNERSEVSGQVEYTLNEEVAAFLVFNPRGQLVTLGLAQGKFHVSRDAVSGEKLARNIFHGWTKSAQTEPALTPAFGPQPPAGKLRLSELKRCVQVVKP